jgi:hypothetical protein
MMNFDGKGARKHLEIQLAVVARTYIVEALLGVCEDPGEDIETSRGTLGIGFGMKRRRKGQCFKQGNQIHMATLEDGRRCEGNLIHDEAREFLAHGVMAGQEATANAIRHWPQS